MSWFQLWNLPEKVTSYVLKPFSVQFQADNVFVGLNAIPLFRNRQFVARILSK